MKNKYFIFVHKHKFRNRALNNFLKIKKIDNYVILNLSGVLRYFIFGLPLIFLTSLFKFFFNNFVLISCDGRPKLISNGVNFWFGGTSYKVPQKYKKYKNNCFFFENFSKKEENLINLYPYKPLFVEKFNSPKIVFVGGFNILEDTIVDEIWDNEKNNIFNSFSIIDNFQFWNKYNLSNNPRLQYYYIQLKERIRFNSIIKINKILKDNFIVVGSRWKKNIPSAMDDEFNVKKIRKLYFGNICLDFGSKWGCNFIYPRSVEIIENGGVLLQAKQKNLPEEMSNLDIITEFNSISQIETISRNLLNDKIYLNQRFSKQFEYFNNAKLNYLTLKKIYNISKKNNI
jgi:hypothetical protein